jgi:hypothetical protein
MSCLICGKPRIVSHYRRLKTCGDPDCVSILKSRNMQAWYASGDSRRLVESRLAAYAQRVSGEVRHVVQELAGDAEMIPRWKVLRIAARSRRIGYHRGFTACFLKGRRRAA